MHDPRPLLLHNANEAWGNHAENKRVETVSTQGVTTASAAWIRRQSAHDAELCLVAPVVVIGLIDCQ